MTNVGNVTLENIEVTDDHFTQALADSDALPDTIAKLAPGESKTYVYTYTVTAKDSGKVINTAKASADDPTSDDPNKKIEETDQTESPVAVPETPAKPTTVNRTGSSPRTGDDTPVGMLIAMMLMSGAALVGLLRRRKENEGR